MKILIIGGSRFIGPRLIEELKKKHHSVTVFNRGNIKKEYGQGIIYVRGDRDVGFTAIKNKFDVVIDTCAYNGRQTKKALDQLKFDHFINIGTAASYKKTDIFPLTEESSLGEWPLWGDYNRGKIECEEILKRSGIKYASVRPVYILGPNNHVNREQFIYSHLKKKEPLILPGNGQGLIQFVFVYDVVNLLLYLAEKRKSGIFNCCGDEAITLRGIVKVMAEITGVKPVLEFNLKADGEKFNPEEFPFANENFFCSNKKLKDLGIEFTPLLQGLKNDYRQYYKKVI
jgi:nucleoside-diphosphate-sugar epimerase